MSIGSVLKKVVAAPVGAAKVVGREVGQALNPPAAPQAPTPGLSDLGFNIPKFELPVLDPNDPDYEEKKAVHDAYEQLGQLHEAYARNAGDEYKTYYNDLAGQIQGQKAGKTFSPLSAFAIGLGNPDALKNVAATNAAAAGTEHDKEIALLNLREKALQGQIQQHMDQGKFAQALKQSGLLAELQATQKRIADAREQANKMAQIEATQKAMTERTRLTNQRMLDVADRRARTISNLIGKLPQDVKAKMQSQLDAARAEFTKAISMNPLTGEEPSEEAKAAAWQNYQNKTDDIYDSAHESVMSPSGAPAAPAVKPAPTAAPAAGGDEKVMIERDGKKGIISKKFVKPTDKVLGPAPK